MIIRRGVVYTLRTCRKEGGCDLCGGKMSIGEEIYMTKPKKRSIRKKRMCQDCGSMYVARGDEVTLDGVYPTPVRVYTREC